MTSRLTFLGYPRKTGRAGTRNHLLILSINGLTAGTARRVAEAVDGARLVATPYGRGQVGPDRELHFRQLVGLATNPNVGAVLVLGADRRSADGVGLAIRERTGIQVEIAALDDVAEDAVQLTAAAMRAAARLARAASHCRRAEVPASDLFVGLECGHSDTTSGLAANPLVGAVADRLIDAGATVVIGETIEWLGGEELLARRAVSGEVASAIRDAVKARQEAVAALGEDLLGNNPGEENIRGGLSTIEEKSIGAIAKAGSRPIRSLLSFCEAPRGPGLHVMDGPSFSPESLTGFTAAGAQIMLFTTGPGNSFCSLLAPNVKVSGNPGTVDRLREQIDFDASEILAGTRTVGDLADRLVPTLLGHASGVLTWGEILREGSECFTRLGPSL